MERLPAGADRGFGAFSQWVAWPVEAGSVKKYGLASKGSAPRQKVWGLHQKVSSKHQQVSRKRRMVWGVTGSLEGHTYTVGTAPSG
ncbi:hypothetical protein CFREI_12830 [Corynebacterium freiburgense]|nr:hypothetical protein CFREI_12830 [Corynebacterium freiburgense]